MTPDQQVELHEHVEDARRALLARHTEESYALAALLSSHRGLINERIRNGERVGLGPHRLHRACSAILATEALTVTGALESGQERTRT